MVLKHHVNVDDSIIFFLCPSILFVKKIYTGSGEKDSLKFFLKIFLDFQKECLKNNTNNLPLKKTASL